MNVVWHWLGLTNASGKTYLFWSGICGDFVLLGGLTVLWHRLNCHAAGCWRIGRHHVAGTSFVTCRKHHPVIDAKPTHEDIAAAHQRAAVGRALKS